MSHIDFKNIHAIKQLSVGDTISGDSGMGGSFTYTVERRKDDGLVLSSSSDASWERDAFHKWDDIKSNFYIDVSSNDFGVNKTHFLSAKKAGYTRLEDFPETLGITNLELARGLNMTVDIFSIKVDDEQVLFENKHDAIFVAKVLGAYPPEALTVSLERYLTMTVNQSVAESLIRHNANEVKREYPHRDTDEQRRTLKNRLDPFIKIPNNAIIDINETMDDSPLNDGIGGTFSRVMNKVAVSAPIRAREMLNDPSSYTREQGELTKNSHNSLITLEVNNKPIQFIHQEVNNQMFVLYNEALGMTSPDVTRDLAVLVKPSLAASKRAIKNDAVQSADLKLKTPSI
jgi:hypothetical protein